MRAFNKIVALKCTSFPYKCCDCNACLFCNAASETPTVFLQALQGSQRLDVIVQKEQQVAGVVTKADADKVIAASVNRIAPAAAAKIDLTAAPAQVASTLARLSSSVEELQEQIRDVSAFSHSKQVEMANTDDVLDIFSNYSEADIANVEVQVGVNVLLGNSAASVSNICSKQLENMSNTSSVFASSTCSLWLNADTSRMFLQLLNGW